jgi:hypothetical protein
MAPPSPAPRAAAPPVAEVRPSQIQGFSIAVPPVLGARPQPPANTPPLPDRGSIYVDGSGGLRSHIAAFHLSKSFGEMLPSNQSRRDTPRDDTPVSYTPPSDRAPSSAPSSFDSGGSCSFSGGSDP